MQQWDGAWLIGYGDQRRLEALDVEVGKSNILHLIYHRKELFDFAREPYEGNLVGN